TRTGTSTSTDCSIFDMDPSFRGSASSGSNRGRAWLISEVQLPRPLLSPLIDAPRLDLDQDDRRILRAVREPASEVVRPEVAFPIHVVADDRGLALDVDPRRRVAGDKAELDRGIGLDLADL